MTNATGYAARAQTYAAETADVPAPHTLHALLRRGLRVAEAPSATGYHLTAYAKHGAEVTLIDTCADMLHLARRRAEDLGTTPQTICCRIEDLTPDHGPIDLVVVPNGALNQLAADSAPGELLTALTRVLPPGGILLAQVLPPPGHPADQPCGFYDPGLEDRTWITDRDFIGDSGQRLVRRRRQHRTGPLLRIDFELTRDSDPAPLYAHTVQLRQLTDRALNTAAAAAGLTFAGISPGAGGLYEMLATRPAGSHR